jgi:hypothetical protein
MSDKSEAGNPLPVPPFFHLTDFNFSINRQTGEIEQLLTFHKNARIAVCYTPKQAQLVIDQLLKLTVARAAATTNQP